MTYLLIRLPRMLFDALNKMTGHSTQEIEQIIIKAIKKFVKEG